MMMPAQCTIPQHPPSLDLPSQPRVPRPLKMNIKDMASPSRLVQRYSSEDREGRTEANKVRTFHSKASPFTRSMVLPSKIEDKEISEISQPRAQRGSPLVGIHQLGNTMNRHKSLNYSSLFSSRRNMDVPSVNTSMHSADRQPKGDRNKDKRVNTTALSRGINLILHEIPSGGTEDLGTDLHVASPGDSRVHIHVQPSNWMKSGRNSSITKNSLKPFATFDSHTRQYKCVHMPRHSNTSHSNSSLTILKDILASKRHIPYSGHMTKNTILNTKF